VANLRKKAKFALFWSSFMGKNKLRRFAEMKNFPNVFEPTALESLSENFALRGLWRTDFFKEPQKIVLELGCGKGEYTLGLAEKYPLHAFVGMDIKGARIWRGAKTAVEKGQNNVAFVRSRIEFLTRFFAPAEIDEIWVTFADPQPKRPLKRLTSPRFLDLYRQILKPEGIVHLKTDSALLYEYSLEIAQQENLPIFYASADLYATTENLPTHLQEIWNIKTHYENLFAGKGYSIKYLCFGLSPKAKV
jgi:tRNA (guanine-N7-)-methyltransferase